MLVEILVSGPYRDYSSNPTGVRAKTLTVGAEVDFPADYAEYLIGKNLVKAAEEPAPEVTKPLAAEEPAPEVTKPLAAEEPAPEVTKPLAAEEPAPEVTKMQVAKKPKGSH